LIAIAITTIAAIASWIVSAILVGWLVEYFFNNLISRAA
jgi:hypothetical protein